MYDRLEMFTKGYSSVESCFTFILVTKFFYQIYGENTLLFRSSVKGNKKLRVEFLQKNKIICKLNNKVLLLIHI